MELLQVRYFVHLAHTSHLTKTAEFFHVTPSAVSSSINRLETELNIKLFDRVGRNIKLNYAGNVLLPYLEDALNSIANGTKEIHDLQSKADATIVLGATSPQLWDEGIAGFRKLYPSYRVRQLAFDSGLPGSRAASDTFDFIIASPSALQDSSWTYQILFEDSIYLVVPSTHRLANRNSIHLIEAKDEWFINSLSDTSFRKYCDELCRNAGFEPKSQIECDYSLRPRLIKNENMVCLATGHGLHSGLFTDVKFLKVLDSGSTRFQALFWKKSKYMTKSCKAFQEFMLYYYRNLFNYHV